MSVSAANARLGTATPAEPRLEHAIDLFQAGRVSQGKAAEIAGLPRRHFSEILAARGSR
ncbi:UPF0175 family protein [Longimicrobium terrae]|uniref:Putative HTH domain antitoxin n=1 Tax=Longimicrobium terrae TaxID=1639882 RepID=A0A841H473_9BACT|nr:putative HTH domain antitoxin [Longimicrobium terrae]MBB6072778.1 putative HTH domain antitoxin [Longimicrobium terrae]NNC30603.1 hypothetical protein [Longimicrobium terrae]